jgi:peptide deformylase
MAVREILLLGNEALYQVAREVDKEELEAAKGIVRDLHDTIMTFREKYGFGRAIAAPQIGNSLRIIYMNFGQQSIAFLNPKLELDAKQYELWDDCMSFPGLEVRVKRHTRCKIFYKDLQWQDQALEFADDLSELIQHEYDHLDGILAVQRAIDSRSFRINPQKTGCF